MKIRPVGNKILCVDMTKKEDEKEQVQGGIIIPITANKFETSFKYVKILDISPKIENPQFKKDDIVMVNLYIGTEIEVDGEKLLIIEPEDIFGVQEI